MERTKTYFLSDLHLGANYLTPEREYEKRVCDFLYSIKDEAREIYLLGDILDYWYEYRYVVPRGYVRFFGALATLADAGVKIYWFIGNHDIWLFDYLRDEIGTTVIDGYITKKIGETTFFLSHGDGLGKLPLGFRFIRSMFRNRICQKLYAAIHPRWTIPFAHAWSSSNREAHAPEAFKGEDEPMVKFAREYLADVNANIDYFIFGHLHNLVNYKLSKKSSLIILGEWISLYSYAVFDGKKLILEQFSRTE
jgi:UDP-2,3-diacylglucosamine hydrolase